MTQIKERDFFFDNARALLIFLVVFGHLLQPYTESDTFLTSLYLTIYSFHMPCFLFISGYFAKKAGQPGYLEKVSKKLLVPYFIFFAFFSLYYYFTGKEDNVTLDPFDPVFALWFLLTLFFFHIILALVKNYKPYFVLPIAIIIALFAGFSDDIGNYLSFSRTIIFFPIFYLGYLFKKEHTQVLRNKKFIPLSILVLIVFYIGYTLHPINSDWLLGSSPYTSLEDEEGLYSPLKRLFLYFTILITMFSFLNLVPEKKRIFTYIGTRTLQVYLLHGLFIGIIRGFKIYPFKDPTSFLTYIYLIVVTCIIVYLLSSYKVAKWTNPVINLEKPSNFKG
ncbi:acyltransferase family protein [Staphylococcus arlettae]|uniref:Acyltransferase n=4 Tax=Staphylococcus arlettae TaxID=29378 RepID=A0A380CJ03_9STAP|nr:acyltransferase family protein [Staphylococcus arlettae]PNZ55238.1 acyltransferase [Staphylococcus arlettae]GEQ00965.1 acyltransferase [Staphylococcus arlettae]SUJ21444.1 acyltransferase family protein [Staphylococcus arlettae]